MRKISPVPMKKLAVIHRQITYRSDLRALSISLHYHLQDDGHPIFTTSFSFEELRRSF